MGYNHSEETKKKFSAANKGRTWTLTQEQRDKLKGRIFTEEHQAKIKDKLKGRSFNADHKAKLLEHLEVYNASVEHQEHLKRLHSSKEHQENLKRLKLRNSHRVLILDTLNNETTVYPSISHAAKVIGCSYTAIRKALKNLSLAGEKGVYSRSIKKRYLVKPEFPVS